jgi:hypothetical protein
MLDGVERLGSPHHANSQTKVLGEMALDRFEPLGRELYHPTAGRLNLLELGVLLGQDGLAKQLPR